MRILFINPNTSASFTEKIQSIASQYASSGTQAVAMNPTSGPRSIESIYDELLSSPGTLELALAQRDNFDAFVIACYSDHPTVYALREITDKPVLGIADASMYMACMLGYKFSVVTTNDEWEPLLWDAVKHFGLAERCASVRTTGMAVLELESGEHDTQALIQQAALKAIHEDGAEVLCLGCAGMTGLDKQLEQVLGVPVIDGVVAALKFLEGMLGYGVRTSKRRVYAQPAPRELMNMAAIFKTAYTNRQ
ncbi:MAG: aspartate/glutamate racemase family protein [Anaerolineales bacterium]